MEGVRGPTASGPLRRFRVAVLWRRAFVGSPPALERRLIGFP